MKCTICKKRMLPMRVSEVYTINGVNIKVVNVPAKQCHVCGKIEVFDLVRKNARRYAKEQKNPVVDYVKCEEDENTNLIVTQMLWFW